MEQLNNLFTEQLDSLSRLDVYVKQRAEELARMPKDEVNESEDTKDITSALAKAQGEYGAVGYNRENPFYKSGYADLNNIMKAVRGPLSKNGLAVTQQTVLSPDGATTLITKIRHSSGQWIASRCRIIPAKSDVQSYASALTYMKRNSLVALLNITVDADYSDDDAEVTMEQVRDKASVATNDNYNVKEEPYRPITREQLLNLKQELLRTPKTEDEILEKLHLVTLADLPQSKYEFAIKRVRKIAEDLEKGRLQQ